MKEPQILYVDEISADEVRATVSDPNSVFQNLHHIQVASGMTMREAAGAVQGGVAVLPAGRFICMVSRAKREGEREGEGQGQGQLVLGNVGMVLLDLTGKEEMGYAIAGRFEHPGLEKRFMEVLYEVSSRKESHDNFRLVLGQSPKKRFL